MHRVDLGESLQTHIYLQNLASTQPRTSPVKFARSSGEKDTKPPPTPWLTSPSREAARHRTTRWLAVSTTSTISWWSTTRSVPRFPAARTTAICGGLPGKTRLSQHSYGSNVRSLLPKSNIVRRTSSQQVIQWCIFFFIASMYFLTFFKDEPFPPGTTRALRISPPSCKHLFHP